MGRRLNTVKKSLTAFFKRLNCTSKTIPPVAEPKDYRSIEVLEGDVDEYDEIQEQIWEIEKATALQELYADEPIVIVPSSRKFDTSRFDHDHLVIEQKGIIIGDFIVHIDGKQ